MDLLGSLGSSRFAAARYAAGLCVILAVGCGSDGKVAVYPVTGSVTVNGAPAAGAKVLLFAENPPETGGAAVPIPEGDVGDDGTFQLTTYEKDDGAPAGNYKVSIVWMEVTIPADDPESRTERDKLKNRYADANASGLTAVVTDGPTELPAFDLK